MQDLRIVPWTWRDGTVHLEMRLASFHHEDDTLVTHLDGEGYFVTACGREWWGIGSSSSGLGHTQNVTCEDCRDLLKHARISIEVAPSDCDPGAWANGYGIQRNPTT